VSKQAVKLLADGLGVGEDTGFVTCPFCQAEHEEKFSVTRIDTGLLYNCFRASCGAAGFVGTGYWESEPGVVPTRPQRKPYTQSLHVLESADVDFFVDTWNLAPRGYRITDSDEYALPILGTTGFRKGWVIRQPRWKGVQCHRYGEPGKPKALTYKDEPDYSRLSWGKKCLDRWAHVVLVEDILSAWKVSQCTYAYGVSLNGADLGYEEVKEVCSVSPLKVSIWLDPDATNQAYKIQSKWGMSFNDCAVLTGDDDPKALSQEILQEKLDADIP
jgi:hypothetical protein